MKPSANLGEPRDGDDPALFDLAEELAARLQSGGAADLEAWIAAQGAHADRLRRLLPTVRVMAELGGAADAAPPRIESEAAPAPGDLGDFRIIREVGRGGMGVVYEAQQVSLGRRVALKVLPLAATLDPRQLQRFHNEARAAAGLHHPNIVPVYAVGCAGAVHFYAMQFIDGQSLAEVIAGQWVGAPTVRTAAAAQATSAAPRDAAYFRRVAQWGIEAAEALDCAHTLGVVHRDVKPANLLVDAGGRLWVTDFGLAQVQSDARLTMTGDVVGTLRYMSPEQALARRVVIDHRTDVYSLGATLYELLTLRPAFDGADRQELLRQVACEEPRTPRRVNKAIPAELETVVLKAMEKNPADRYATAKDLADDLGRYLRDEPIRARRPGLARRARKWARRHRAATTAGAVCLLVALAALGWVLGDGAGRRDTVRAALEATEPGLREGNPWDRSLMAATERAEAQLGGGLVGPDLRRRVGQLRKDVRMLEELERIRLDRVGVWDGRSDMVASDPQYARAFRDYGIDAEALGAEGTADRVRRSAIREHLVAALDNWACGLARLVGKEGASPKAERLLAAARLVDPDPWRNRLRDTMLSWDDNELEQLARSAPVEELPATTLGLLGHMARARPSVAGPLTGPLRRAQRRFPADFWINHNLAFALCQTRPPSLEEAIGYLRAAAALRPSSLAVRINLGRALHHKGDVDGAVAEYREAARLRGDSARVLIDLAHDLLEEGQLDEAIALHREAVASLSDDNDAGGAHLSLGQALQKKGLPDQAIAEYREAMTRYRQNACTAEVPDKLSIFRLIRHEIGSALYDQRRYKEAEAEFREVLRMDPDFPGCHRELGNALYGQGRYKEAEAEYREAIR